MNSFGEDMKINRRSFLGFAGALPTFRYKQFAADPACAEIHVKDGGSKVYKNPDTKIFINRRDCTHLCQHLDIRFVNEQQKTYHSIEFGKIPEQYSPSRIKIEAVFLARSNWKERLPVNKAIQERCHVRITFQDKDIACGYFELLSQHCVKDVIPVPFKLIFSFISV